MSNDSTTTSAIKDLARQYLTRVRPAGPDNLVALCPFHNDSHPSFAINIHTGLWICYACGEKGNFYSFLLKVGMSKEDISLHYGVTLRDIKRNMPPPKVVTDANIYSEPNRRIPEELLGIFRKCPNKLVEEGFQPGILKHFNVGVDLMHNRITFPLRDLDGYLVGISGRALDDSMQSRYKVYKEEYEAWDLPRYETEKGSLLWNAHSVYKTYKPGEPIIIVEGFKACMWVHQAGLKNVVALMTKVISDEQLLILAKFENSPYVLMLDNDESGITGTVKSCEDLTRFTRDVRIVLYDAHQPTDVPLEYIPELIRSATDYYELLLDVMSDESLSDT